MQLYQQVFMRAVIPVFTFWTPQFAPSSCLASEDSCPLLQIALVRAFPWTGVSSFRICLPRLLPGLRWISLGQKCLDLVHYGFLLVHFFILNDCLSFVASLTPDHNASSPCSIGLSLSESDVVDIHVVVFNS